MTKQELEFNKLNTLSILTSPQKWVRSGIAGSYKTVIRWSDKWEFECESNMRRFTTESIFEAVDWYYADVDTEEDFHKEESKSNLDENYELEAKDDKEQSKLAEVLTEATREARLDVLEAIKTFCYSACESTHNKTKKRAYHEVIDLIKSLGKVVDNQ